ncbi:MAG: MarR family winged helix-turn-helix transcriptional regulator [Pseudomonadota bacterium]
MNDSASTGEPALDLERFLPYRLSLLAHLVGKGISEAYRTKHGLSTAQWRVLAAVAEHPGITAQRVVAMTPMDKVMVSRAVAALSDQGLVERRASTADGRKSLLGLTGSGRRIYRAIAPRARAYAEALQEELSEAERAQLEVLTGRLIDAARRLEEPKAEA